MPVTYVSHVVIIVMHCHDAGTHTLVYVGSQPIDAIALTGSAGEFVCNRPNFQDETGEDGEPITPATDPQADYDQPLLCVPEQYSRN